MNGRSVIYDAVSGLLPTDDVDIGVAIVRYSAKDSKLPAHAEGYIGLTFGEIMRELARGGEKVSKKNLRRILVDLTSNGLLNCRGNSHYISKSRFT